LGSGGGGNSTETTKNALPAWAIPFAKGIFGQASQDFFPNGQLLPASQGVAGFSPDQLAAQQMTEQLSGVAPNAGQGYINFQAGPASNQNPGPSGPTTPTAGLPGIASSGAAMPAQTGSTK
jgi:hypothetical protein